jgi:hypothetical protein
MFGAATAFTGAITFSSSDPNATLPADYTFQAGERGQRAFSMSC